MDLFLSAQKIALNNRYKINKTWKIHTLLCYVQPYIP